MEGLFIIVAIYVVLSVLGAMQKKARQEQQRAGGAAGGALARQDKNLPALQRALQELERAEREALAKQRTRLPELDGRTPISFPLPPQRRFEPAPFDYDEEAAADADEGEEEILPEEAINLDDESAREVEERRRAYDVVVRKVAPAERRPVPKPAPVAPTVAPAIVPRVAVKEEEPAAPMKRRARAGRRGVVDFRRLVATDARTAMVLAEILQPPVGERY